MSHGVTEVQHATSRSQGPCRPVDGAQPSLYCLVTLVMQEGQAWWRYRAQNVAWSLAELKPVVGQVQPLHQLRFNLCPLNSEVLLGPNSPTSVLGKVTVGQHQG